jgi:hypothetical protein
MPSTDKCHAPMTSSDRELVLASLDRDQLTGLKKQLIPRRRLSGLERFILWSLRIYLLFMMAVVVYQVWLGSHEQ